LKAGAFAHFNDTPQVDDCIIYDNEVTGRLFFDPDGAGGVAATPFALVANLANLSNTDFIVV